MKNKIDNMESTLSTELPIKAVKVIGVVSFLGGLATASDSAYTVGLFLVTIACAVILILKELKNSV